MAGREPAERLFWRTPELLDKLIHFLDVESVSELAQAHQLTAKVLEGTRTWDKLVKMCCPYYEHKGLLVEECSGWEDDVYRPWVKQRLSTQQINISHLTRILSQMENPKVPLLELLHVICERFPPVLFSPEEHVYPFSPEENGQPMAFHLRCPCKRTHSVTHLGFLLLEKVEGTLGSAEQEVESVFLGNLEEPCFSALESRASRQEKKVGKVEAIRFVCNDQDPVDHTMGKLYSLQKNCQKLTFSGLWIWDCREDEEAPRPKRLGQDFWAQLAKALKLDNFGAHEIWATRHDLQGGSRDDLRAIWDAMAADSEDYSSFFVTEVPSLKGLGQSTIEIFWDSEERKEKRWIDLQLMLDRHPKQWPEAFAQFFGKVVDEDGSEDSEDF